VARDGHTVVSSQSDRAPVEQLVMQGAEGDSVGNLVWPGGPHAAPNWAGARRRGTARMGADNLSRRRAQEGRTEDDPLPAAPCRRDSRAASAAAHLAAGRDMALGCNAQAGLLEAADRFPITSGVPAPIRQR